MSADEIQERSGIADLLAGLTDSDVVVEVAAAASGRKTAQMGPAQLLQEAVEASYRALAGSDRIALETVAVVEEVAKRSLSLWLRVKANGGEHWGRRADPSSLKFLARGTLAIIAWMDGSPTLQLADLQQAIRVLAWGTSITTTRSAGAAFVGRPRQRDRGVAAGQGASAPAIRSGSSPTTARPSSIPARGSPSRGRFCLTRRLVNHSADMIFVVEMPDYQATGQWQLKHGDTRTTAFCESGTLLDKFYRRELDIRPGDAIALPRGFRDILRSRSRSARRALSDRRDHRGSSALEGRCRAAAAAAEPAPARRRRGARDAASCDIIRRQVFALQHLLASGTKRAHNPRSGKRFCEVRCSTMPMKSSAPFSQVRAS